MDYDHMIDIELMIHVALKRPSRICVIYKHSLYLNRSLTRCGGRFRQNESWGGCRDSTVDGKLEHEFFRSVIQRV